MWELITANQLFLSGRTSPLSVVQGSDLYTALMRSLLDDSSPMNDNASRNEYESSSLLSAANGNPSADDAPGNEDEGPSWDAEEGTAPNGLWKQCKDFLVHKWLNLLGNIL